MPAKVATCLWMDGTAEEAAAWYASLVPGSSVDSVLRGPDGAAIVVELTLGGAAIQLLNGGPKFKLTEAASIVVHAEDQQAMLQMRKIDIAALEAAFRGEAGKPAPVVVTAQTSADPASAFAVFTDPAAIQRWNFASEDWSCPAATVDLRAGGTFCYRMAARDGSMAFDYEGTWQELSRPNRLVQVLGDGRRVVVTFEATAAGTKITERFDPDDQAPIALQRAGWQAILDRFAAMSSGS